MRPPEAAAPPAQSRWRLGGSLSIRAALIALLVPGLIGLLAIDSWNDYRTLAEVTQDAYDNALLEPVRVLESSVDTDEAGELRL